MVEDLVKAVYNDLKMIVYLVENKRNGKRYVGLTKHDLETRWGQHVKDALYERSNMLLHKAIRKNGPDGFVRSVIDEGESEEQLRQLERDWIEALGTHVSLGKGYNMTFGGDGVSGWSPSKEHREAIRQAHLGEKNCNYGKNWGKTNWTEEERQEISKKRMGDGNPMRGKHHSVEARQKISEAAQRAKLPVRVAKYSLDGALIEVFNSMSLAMKSIGGGNVNGIRRCLLGKQENYRGFRWKAEEEKG